MRAASRLLIIAVVFASWLAAAPPARACTPLPEQPWFLPNFEIQQYRDVIEFLGPDGNEGYSRTYFYFSPLTINNLSSEVIYLLGSNQLRNPEPLDGPAYNAPPGFEAYFAIGPGEAAEVRDGELIAIAFGLEDRNIYQATRPAEVAVPESQEGKIWLVLGGEAHLAPITLTYGVNPSFFETDPEACARFLQLESYQFMWQALLRCISLAAVVGLVLTVSLLVIRKRRKDSAGQ